MAAQEQVVVVPEYHSAYNAVVEPDKIVACTRYWVRRWMPELGGVGTQIVLALRSLGFYNRHTGEMRDGIEIEMADLARLVGVHVATLKREFGDKKGQPGVPQNPALRLFVSKDRQYWRDPVTNRLLRTANVYRVKMDDPLHPDDLTRLQQILAENEKGRQTPGESSKAQIALQAPGSKRGQASKAQIAPCEAQFAPSGAQIAPKKNHIAPQGAQIAPTLIEDSPLPKNTGITPATSAAPGDPLSLFEGREEPVMTLAERALADADSAFARDWRARKKKEGASPPEH